MHESMIKTRLGEFALSTVQNRSVVRVHGVSKKTRQAQLAPLGRFAFDLRIAIVTT